MNQMGDMSGRKRSYDTHMSDRRSHAYSSNIIVPSAPYQWHDMDYISPTVEAPRFTPTSAPVQYAPHGAMPFLPVNYAHSDYSLPAQYPENHGSSSMPAPAMYRVGPLAYTELAALDGDTASLSQESIYSRSTRLHSLTDSERRSSQTNSVMSSNDVRRESEGFDKIFPMTPMETENGPNDVCGADLQCLDLNNMGSLEACAYPQYATESPRHALPRLQPDAYDSTERDSPINDVHSTLSSPTLLTRQDTATSEPTRIVKPKRAPRSKSANSGVVEVDKATKLRARQAHSLVERKYRDNLNSKISQLHQTLQTARFGPNSTVRSPNKEFKSDYFDDDTIPSPEAPSERSPAAAAPSGAKVRKSDVLSEAMNYVAVTELEMKQMSEEINRLSARLKSLESPVRCDNCNRLGHMGTLHVQSQHARTMH